MIEIVKRYPLVGLAIAITGGLVLAHILNEFVDFLWLTYLGDFVNKNWDSLLAWCVILALTVSAYFGWKRMHAKVDFARLSPRRFKSRGHWLFGMFSVACVIVFGVDVIIHGALMLFSR